MTLGYAHDNGIQDPAQREYIAQQLFGKPKELIVYFYEESERDTKAEAEQRERIESGSDEVARPYFKARVYINRQRKGQKDHVARPATDQDKRDHSQEWEHFKANKNKPAKHSIELLPGNTVCTQSVFDELNITTIEDFLSFVEDQPKIIEIFDELVPLHEAAKRWRTFMKPRLKLVNGEAQ